MRRQLRRDRLRPSLPRRVLARARLAQRRKRRMPRKRERPRARCILQTIRIAVVAGVVVAGMGRSRKAPRPTRRQRLKPRMKRHLPPPQPKAISLSFNNRRAACISKPSLRAANSPSQLYRPAIDRAGAGVVVVACGPKVRRQAARLWRPHRARARSNSNSNNNVASAAHAGVVGATAIASEAMVRGPTISVARVKDATLKDAMLKEGASVAKASGGIAIADRDAARVGSPSVKAAIAIVVVAAIGATSRRRSFTRSNLSSIAASRTSPRRRRPKAKRRQRAERGASIGRSSSARSPISARQKRFRRSTS